MNVYEIHNRAMTGSHQVERVVDREFQKMLEAVWADTSLELSRLASSMGINADRIEDVIHDVFHLAWTRGAKCGSHDQIRRWLVRVTINHCNLLHRRQHRWRRAWTQMVRIRETFLSPRDVSGHENALTNDDRQLVTLALDELPPKQRNVLVLRYFQGYDSTTIGRILEMPPTTVRSHLRKARMTLASQLRKVGYEDE
jgi:RNA polymerase sigma factor (sigma-70 family)